MPETFDLATVLQDVADTLVAGGVRSATPDPSELLLPGVWVQCTGFEQVALSADSYVVDIRLMLTVDDNGHMRAVKALSKLYRQVVPLVSIIGPVTPALSALDEETNLPALAVPTRVRWTP